MNSFVKVKYNGDGCESLQGKRNVMVNWIITSRLIFSIFILIAFSYRSSAQLTYKELKVQYDSAWTFRNLQIIPVRFKSGPADIAPKNEPNQKRPMSLSEAIQKGKLKVQEIPYEKGADVNWLQVTNESKQDVVIQTGEILDGGKQDRMVGETKVVPAGVTDYIHVYCVEKRRWSDKPKKFKAAGIANSDLQKAMHTKGRQSEVWREIDRQFKENEKKSETYSYLELPNRIVKDDSDYYKYFTGRYSLTDSTYAGYIFLTGNRILNTELYSKAELTNVAFRNMLISNIQTARQSGSLPAVPLLKVTAFMDQVLTNETLQKSYVTAHGKLQYNEGKVLHLIAYDN